MVLDVVVVGLVQAVVWGFVVGLVVLVAVRVRLGRPAGGDDGRGRGEGGDQDRAVPRPRRLVGLGVGDDVEVGAHHAKLFMIVVILSAIRVNPPPAPVATLK
ncbi:hypothetical protein GCM10010346_16340 [Streptomyces chryseus]|uniref:Secreted protein n=1 Tax=Streptomyces chryseus TaxID=68186 RepID=A0ABQ3DID9_9ACTN|nr:hypothetical protein GCM10010346_16340 [Streptomyces chryseus]